ncbi:FkbM family methyltransferase [Confluentibacter flavum]|uniref:Methyltransferase FkbM domain-containing protein n=1 Tax=Confluentibacter flavum TaxID=1909700 RepID=A0A2N3HLC6_9FLAO|nr:FkbM family methyltransferase [Confluentibacter flavum]PKQ45756.1 hypothetical protein CSW08_06730 [Confluentibacter flavum]
MGTKKITLKKVKNKISNIILINLRRIFNVLGYQISENTDKSKILELIKTVRPYETNLGLVRLGGIEDGGYVVPNDLIGIEACFSPGVDKESGFEIDCLKRGMQVYMADNSVDKPNIDSSKFNYNFIKKHIGTTSNEDYITFTDWVNSSNIETNRDLLLQMDIEGAEYLTILSADESIIKRFRIILIEFHFLERLWNDDFYSLVEPVFKKLLKTHTCIHIHPNNCSKIVKHNNIQIPPVLEFSFIRNDRFTNKEPQVNFPNELDNTNLNNIPDVILPKIWYAD